MKNLFILLILTLFLIACESATENLPELEQEPGRRDYVWTIDTLDIFYPTYKIWGSSPNDVWAINESDFSTNLWHFDGSKWSTDRAFRNIYPKAIYGFSQNQVYMGGVNGSIWLYDGRNWNQSASLNKEGTDFISFQNIWGKNPNDFYAVGCGPDDNLYANHSVIAHYFNNKWTFLNTDSLIGNVIHLYKNTPDNKIYFRLTKIGGTEHVDSTIIYEYKNSQFIKLYSSIYSRGYQADISLIKNEVYFILGNEISKRINNQFQTIIHIDNPNFYHRIWGRDSKEIFLLMTDGLCHYNGSDIEYLFKFSYPETKPSIQIYGAALFEKEVFFTVYEPPTKLKLIYHGKLKEL